MHLVRPRGRHHRDLAAGTFAVLSAVGITEHVVFTHRIHTEQLVAGALRRDVLARRVVAHVVHTVHGEPVGFRALAADGE